MERFAAVLDRRARSLVRGLTITGAIVGGAVGALPLTPAGHIWPVPHFFGFTTLALGIAAGAVLGYGVVKNRAGMLRLHAQSTLCQLHAQRTTFALWLLLKDRTPDLFAAAEVAAPEPVPVPVAPEPEP